MVSGATMGTAAPATVPSAPAPKRGRPWYTESTSRATMPMRPSSSRSPAACAPITGRFGNMPPLPAMDSAGIAAVTAYVRWLQRQAGIH